MSKDHREIRYYFGRLNIIASYDSKREFLMKGFKAGIELEIRSFQWGYYNISEMNVRNGTIITGYFVKYAPKKREQVAEKTSHRLKVEDARNRVIAKSRFFLHVDSGIIAYHPISGRIGENQFRENFCKLFEKSHRNFFVDVKIQTIDEEKELLKCIGKFDIIHSITITLHPSNPSNRKEWKDIDNRLKKLEAESYKEEIKASVNSDRGLHEIDKDDDIMGKIQMTEDGYGESRIKGRMNGEEKTVSTKGCSKTTMAPNDDFSTEEVWQTLKQAFNRILSRFK